MMPKNQKLRSFLQKEVKKQRIQPPSPPDRTELDISLEGSSSTIPAEDSTFIPDTDSLFGDPIISKEAKVEERLQKFLSQSSSVRSQLPTASSSVSVNPTLESLKDELKNLVYCVEDATPREKELFQRQKAALIEEISQLEGGTNADKEKESKGKITFFPVVNPLTDCSKYLKATFASVQQ